jgi:malonyl CoA-acyl carrier protein transacylase
VKELLAVLRERHGLDRDTVAAMAFERSRQQKVSLIQAVTDLVAELDQVAGSNAPARAVPASGTSNDVNTTERVFRTAKDVADAIMERRLHAPQQPQEE